MKKLFVWMMSAALCVGLAACTPAPADNTTTSDATQDNTADETVQDTADETAEPLTEAEAAYQAKIAELEPAEGETEVHWVVFPYGTGASNS